MQPEWMDDDEYEEYKMTAEGAAELRGTDSLDPWEWED